MATLTMTRTDPAIERYRARARLGFALVLIALIVGTFAGVTVHELMAPLIHAVDSLTAVHAP